MFSTACKFLVKRTFAPALGRMSLQTARMFSSTIIKRNEVMPKDTITRDDTPFDFTAENYEKVYQILAKYPKDKKRSGIIPLLHLAQEQAGGFIPFKAMKKIAEICQVPPRDVYECVTFYSMFNSEKIGKYHIQVCVTMNCMITGSDDIVAALENHLGIKMGETTKDGMFTLSEMECMGCCCNAPMIAIADYSKAPNGFSYNYYEDLTPKRAIEIVEMIKRGEQPPVGSQTGRQYSMGIKGKTTLLKEPSGPYCRDLNQC